MRRSMIFAMSAVLAAAGFSVYLASSASAATACGAAWSSSATYVKDNVASQSGHNYTAKWWTQNESPATHSGQRGVWADTGAWGGASAPPPAPTTPPTRAPPTTTPPPTPPATTPPTTV